MFRNPSYPTVTPKTTCEDLGAYGTWRIVRDDVSKEKEEEIRALQDACLKKRKPPPTQPSPPSPDIPAPLPHPPFDKLDDKRYNKCMANMVDEFKNLNKYCLNPDGSHLAMKEFTDSFCRTGEFDVMCASPSGFRAQRQRGNCSYQESDRESMSDIEATKDVTRLNIQMNGDLSCLPTQFNRTEFETSLHTNFLGKKCNNIVDGRCKGDGLIPNNDDVTKLSAINRGFNERWYSEIELLDKKNIEIRSETPRVERDPPLTDDSEDDSEDDFHTRIEKERIDAERLARAAEAAEFARARAADARARAAEQAKERAAAARRPRPRRRKGH